MLRNEKKRLRRESEREKASDKRDDRKQTREFINKKNKLNLGIIADYANRLTHNWYYQHY